MRRSRNDDEKTMSAGETSEIPPETVRICSRLSHLRSKFPNAMNIIRFYSEDRRFFAEFSGLNHEVEKSSVSDERNSRWTPSHIYA